MFKILKVTRGGRTTNNIGKENGTKRHLNEYVVVKRRRIKNFTIIEK